MRSVDHASAADERPPVAFIGTGQIGGPMVRRLLADGVEVHVHARRPDVRDDLAAAGAVIHDSVARAVTGRSVVLVCLYDDSQLREVCLGPDGAIAAMPRGGLLASHTTGLPSTLAELAEAASARGVDVIDAPFSGTSKDVLAGRLTIMIGGDDATQERIAPFVRAYARTVIRTGPRGSALSVKLVNNLLFAAQAQLTAHVLRIGDALDLDRATLLEAVAASSGSSAFITKLGGYPDAETMFATVTPYLTKDVRMARAVADELGVDLGVVGATVSDGPLDLTPG